MNKPKTSSRYAVQADASFAFRGLIDATSRSGRMNGVYRQIPSFELHEGHRAITQLPYASSSFSRTSLRMMLPVVSRAIHGSRILTESTRGIASNRPLSPHLPIKKPQLSATFSISHRIFGAALTSFIMLVPVAYKFTVLYDV